MENKWVFALCSFLLCLFITSCNSRAEVPYQEYTSICDTKPELELDYITASQSLSSVDQFNGFALHELGMDGANELAAELFTGETFCTIGISPATQAVLDEVIQLASENKQDKARELLNQLMINLELSSESLAKMAKPALNEGNRQTIADYIGAAEAEIISGLGDGQDFMNAAQEKFNQFADQQLGSGGFKDMLNLAEEAALLGNEEVMQQALERAKQMNREDIEETLKDFDPCLPNSKQIKQDIADLLKKLQTATLLGDNSNTSLNQAEMIWTKIGQAVQIHFMDQPIAKMISEEYLTKTPACCKDGILTVEQVAFTEYFSTDIPYSVKTTQDGNEIFGEGEMAFTEELGGKAYNYQMVVRINGICVTASDGNQLRLTITTKGNVTISGGGATGGWSLDDQHEIVIPEMEGADQEIIREGIIYRTFTLHPNDY